MRERGYTLSKDAAMRTANAVRHVEKMQKSLQPMRMGRNLPRGKGGTTTTSVEVDIVLIDKDILLVDDEPKGITEADPANTLLPADIELTADEIRAGYSSANHVFQDPPDDNYSENNLDPRELPLYQYTRRKVELKLYEAGDPFYGTCTGGSSTSITLEVGSSDEDDYYTDETVTLLDHYGDPIESRTVTAYDGATRVATVDSAWTNNPVNGDDYKMSVSRDLKLGYTIIDDPDNDRKIVRYKYISVWYDDGKPLRLGEYSRADYPGYDENAEWPPSGYPENYFKRKWRGIVIGGVLITQLCWPLPPPPLNEE